MIMMMTILIVLFGLSYSNLNFTKHTEKYVKYTPTDVETAMSKFFQDQ